MATNTGFTINPIFVDTSSTTSFSNVFSALRNIADEASITELNQDVVFHANQEPNWLPAAIILPIAGAVILLVIVILSITRATRLFRSGRTVLIAHPSAAPTATPPKSPPTQTVTVVVDENRNGLTNPAFSLGKDQFQDVSLRL